MWLRLYQIDTYQYESWHTVKLGYYINKQANDEVMLTAARLSFITYPLSLKIAWETYCMHVYIYIYIYINALFGLWILGIALQSHMISMLTHSDGEIHTYMHYLAFTMALFGHHNLLSSYKTILNYNRHGILRSTQIGN